MGILYNLSSNRCLKLFEGLFSPFPIGNLIILSTIFYILD